jgi:hypothetical protein
LSNARYLALLRELALSVRFVTIGSAGLVLLDETHALHDVDIVLGPDELEAFAKWANTRGSITVWGEPWSGEWNERSLAGKFYVRAMIDGLQVDATFEFPHDAAALISSARIIDGIPVCPEHVLRESRATRK